MTPTIRRPKASLAAARQNVIRQVYEDPREGFGSVANTLRLARRRDPSVRRADVQRFMQGLRGRSVFKVKRSQGQLLVVGPYRKPRRWDCQCLNPCVCHVIQQAYQRCPVPTLCEYSWQTHCSGRLVGSCIIAWTSDFSDDRGKPQKFSCVAV